MFSIEERNHVPLKGCYDVIVAGGGVAGVAAAVAARRAGCSVLLIEKSLTLGGLATLGQINLFVPMCNGYGRQIIKGLIDEMIALSIRYGYDSMPPAWRNGDPGPGEKARYVTRFSAQIFALALTEWMVKEGVVLLLDSVVSAPVMDGTHCQGLIVENKSGREYYQAGMVVDVTGDADVLFRAGVPTFQGLNFFTYVAYGITLESCRRAVESGNIAQAYVGFHGGHASLYGHRHPATRRRYEGTSAQDVTAYVVDNQLELLESIRGDERSSREITTLPGMAQFRTTRCIKGEHTLREADKYRHFEDSVGAICDFDNRGFLYEVPFGCLVRKGYDNLLTAGRSASATGYAWDVLRVIPPAILTGQAAGEAAALALQTSKPVWDVEIKALQQRMVKTGVILHFEDAWIPEGDAAVPASEDIGHI